MVQLLDVLLDWITLNMFVFPQIGGGSLSYGTITSFDSDVEHCDITALDAQTYLVVYTNNAKTALYARVITTSSGVSVGAEQTIATGINVTVGSFEVEKISTTKAVMAYCYSTANDVFAYNLAISGTTVTPSTRLTVEASGAGSTDVSVGVYDSTYALIAPNRDNAYLIDVSGTNPSNVSNIAAHTVGTFTACTLIDTNHMFVGYASTTAANGIIVKNTTGTLSKGSAASLLSGSGGNYIDVAKVTSTKALVSSALTPVKMEHTAVSTTSITSGNSVSLDTGTTVPMGVAYTGGAKGIIITKDSSNDLRGYLINTSSTDPYTPYNSVIADTSTYGGIDSGKLSYDGSGETGVVFRDSVTDTGYFVTIRA